MLESKVQEAWRVLRIQSELVDGTDKLLKLGVAVTVFGGAQTGLEGNRYYHVRRRSWASCSAKSDIPVITGGGPGHYGGSQPRLFCHTYTLGRIKY